MIAVQTYESDMIDTIAASGGRPDLDACCKRMMSSKVVIAKLLQAVVPEFADCEYNEIIRLISDVTVSTDTVDADITPVIKNESVVDGMCNISTMYIEKGILKEKINMIIEMAKKNFPISMIPDIAHISEDETNRIIEENS